MAGGSYAIINIVTIVGALASYVPLTNLSLKVGRKKVALASSVVMVSCPLVLWLVPGFSPVLYLVFLLMGVSLGGAKHGDAILIDEVVRREEVAEAE